jgi:DNA-binding CsgD family transcriptional regulator/PAS domain-containing protein
MTRSLVEETRMGAAAGGAKGTTARPKPVDAPGLTDAAQPVAKASSADLHVVVDRCEFPLFVWSPPEGTINLANEAAAELFHVPLDQLVGSRVFDYVEPRASIERTASVLASGDADRLSGQRLLHRVGLGDIPIKFWTRAIELDGQPRIVALVLPRDDVVAKLGRDPTVPWRDLMPIAVGLVDARWRIVEVSTDISRIVGRTPDQLLGTELLQLFDPDDASTIRRDVRVPPESAVDLRHVRLGHGQGGAADVSLMVASYNMYPDCAVFAVVGVPDSAADLLADRVLDLEMRLRRIGSEVRAAGVIDTVHSLPALELHPKLGDLTTRQWEVLGLLLQGQRVPTIASQLFVSQSTVRNHLATIFRKFGVHSQAELLQLLRGTTVPAGAPRAN